MCKRIGYSENKLLHQKSLVTNVTDIMPHKNNRIPLSCSLLQVVDIFSRCDIDTSLVIQLLTHCQALAEDILTHETNSLHSVRVYYISRLLASSLCAGAPANSFLFI
jgi:hypothetical protein